MFKNDLVGYVTNPNELMKAGFMGGSRTAIYNLFNREDFPKFRIGRKMYISKEKLMEWLDQQTEANK